MSDNYHDNSRNHGRVQMMEIITSRHTTLVHGRNERHQQQQDHSRIDIGSLLEKMDICTCACAEKHTGVNCVTVSMSDVVFEYFPHAGELLELTAIPVYTGNTSLDVFIEVIAEGSNFRVRRKVCEALFTYVTMRNERGEKQYCPPLPPLSDDDEKAEWNRTLAKSRKSLIRMESQQRPNNLLSTSILGPSSPSSAESNTVYNQQFDLELTEVVLPMHQNHMSHTFGGIVMNWMSKAALACASRQSLDRTASDLLIRAIVRIDFATGSQVSDHLILRTKLTQVFDQGRSAEIKVQVVKQSISTKQEVPMNVGYFYISGSAIGTGLDIPFECKPQHDSIETVAAWRRRLMLARRQLLAGQGDPVEWHESLQAQAPLLTIRSVLRLVHHKDPSVVWRSLSTASLLPASSSLKMESMEWTPGEAWGRNDTFVLRVKGIILQNSNMISLTDILEIVKKRRPEWDPHCERIELLEECNDTRIGLHHRKNDNVDEPISMLQWDVVQHYALTPQQFLNSKDQQDRSVPFTYLRTWKVDSSSATGDNDTAILALQSVLHAKSKENAQSNVRPSGWFFRTHTTTMHSGGEDDTNHSHIELTYIVEHDLISLRSIAKGRSDDYIVENLAELAATWFQNLCNIIS